MAGFERHSAALAGGLPVCHGCGGEVSGSERMGWEGGRTACTWAEVWRRRTGLLMCFYAFLTSLLSSLFLGLRLRKTLLLGFPE